MRKVIKFAAFGLPACAMLALAQPASAEKASGEANTNAAESVQKADGKAAAKKICVNASLDTGTRMTRRVCKTKAEWAAEGEEFQSRS